MTRNELITLVCAQEGKKVQVSVGNVREIIKVLVELELTHLAEGTKGNSPSEVIHLEALKKLK